MASRAHRVIAGIFAIVTASAIAAGKAAPLSAADDERTISFYHIHTKETLTVTYKRNGEFIPGALEKIDWIMRDWRKNQATKMDPETVDIIWEMHEELQSKEPVHIICGYRSRDTNEMLRRTVGGQASQSQHITGKAIDITFPDVPLRRMRYSAMIRERGGVGYYPTSGVPFVHVDTSRVRHWPRMVRNELALIFPSGHSKHEPSDGRPLTPGDVARARSSNPELATEVAAFFDLRSRPKTTIMVAEAGPKLRSEPRIVQRPVDRSTRMSIGAPLPPAETLEPERMAPVTAPKLVLTPKPLDRPTRFTTALGTRDKARLDQLVTLASLEVAAPAVPPSRKSIAATPPPAKNETKVTAPSNPAPQPPLPNPLMSAGSRSAWVVAPDFDDDHPEELSYRPFAILPLMTETASLDDPALAQMVHPDTEKALDLIDDDGRSEPLTLGPGRQTASLMWAQEFSGVDADVATSLNAHPKASQPASASAELASRLVKTQPR